jgi:hypothetical protein
MLSGGRGCVYPRNKAMWRNQRARRAVRENLKDCIDSGPFRYRGYQVERSLKYPQWNFGVPSADHWHGHCVTAEDCMRQIDSLLAS